MYKHCNDSYDFGGLIYADNLLTHGITFTTWAPQMLSPWRHLPFLTRLWVEVVGVMQSIVIYHPYWFGPSNTIRVLCRRLRRRDHVSPHWQCPPRPPLTIMTGVWCWCSPFLLAASIDRHHTDVYHPESLRPPFLYLYTWGDYQFHWELSPR